MSDIIFVIKHAKSILDLRDAPIDPYLMFGELESARQSIQKYNYQLIKLPKTFIGYFVELWVTPEIDRSTFSGIQAIRLRDNGPGGPFNYDPDDGGGVA